MDKKELTIKQENFCQYYIDTDGNASEAYRMAYDASKMKMETVNRTAFDLHRNPKITARIAQIKAKRDEESKVSRKKVEQVLMDIVTAEPSAMYIVDTATGKIKMKNPTQMNKRLRNAIKRITNDKGRITCEFNSKTEAARLLGNWNGWDAPISVNQTNHNVGELRIGFDNKDE